MSYGAPPKQNTGVGAPQQQQVYGAPPGTQAAPPPPAPAEQGMASNTAPMATTAAAPPSNTGDAYTGSGQDNWQYQDGTGGTGGTVVAGGTGGAGGGDRNIPHADYREGTHNEFDREGYNAYGGNNYQGYEGVDLGQRFVADQGTYDKFTDAAYQQAERQLNPMFERQQKAFEQKAINRGLSPGTEAYNTAFDQHMRQQNDAYSQAAYGAMQHGASRLDADRQAHELARQFDVNSVEQNKAMAAQMGLSYDQLAEQARQVDNSMYEQARQYDNSFGENQRQFDNSFFEQQRQADQNNNLGWGGVDASIANANTAANAQLGAAGINASSAMDRARLAQREQARQFDLGYGEGNRRFDLNFDEGNRRFDDQNTWNQFTQGQGLEQGWNDRDYRDAVFNAQQDQQQFNNMFNMMGFAPQSGGQGVSTGNNFAGDYMDWKNNQNMWTGIGQGVGDWASTKPWENWGQTQGGGSNVPGGAPGAGNMQ